MTHDRREYQRLALTQPLDAWFGDEPVLLLDVSATGALIESAEPIPAGLRAVLHFKWKEHDVTIKAEAVRKEDDKAGLHFVEDNEQLRGLIVESATEVLRAQQANMEGDRARNRIDGEATLTTASAGLRASGYVSWILEEGEWRRRQALIPDQPDDGFTVSASEPDEQVALLRATYEKGDAEQRRLTRLLAELSVATVR